MQTPSPAAPRNGFGTTALILGICAAATGWIPLIGIVAWPLSILGLIFGVLGIVRASKGQATNKGQAVTGTVLAVLGLVFCIIYVAAIANGAMSYSQQVNKPNGNQPIMPGEPPASQATEPTPQAPAIVRYEVTAKSALNVTFGESASTSQDTNPTLPWAREVPAAGGVAFYSLVAQNGNSNEPISCRITVGGEVLAENQSTGPYAVVNCFGNSGF
ncbi:hypothetical protein HUO13_03875 [Saccharopolyspora erythraea]|uniref:MmpS family transport accessory protein n=1 Tax=Saccharopolyspora erythraea TaxID=1836 RepID=UPI001BA93CFA|nr:MmpS family transport accessory protein [Saccharopolyspora erythraea]QUH00064.1 hypothetical protein HUO13_03875 [Saccharopolyspora erythraea]